MIVAHALSGNKAALLKNAKRTALSSAKNLAADLLSDPFINYRYRIEIEGMEMMGFSKVSEFSNETEIKTFKEGGLNNHVHKLTDGTSYANITFEHGLSLDNTLYEWRQEVINGNMLEALRSGSIKLYAQNHLTSIWNFHGAWPSKLVVSGLDAGTTGNDVIIESVELVIERFERNTSIDPLSFVGLG